MKKSSLKTGFSLLICTFFLAFIFISCKKEENPIKFPKGTFTDTATVALTDINSAYDDYNLDIHQLLNRVILLFSSNRTSSGGQFDLVQGAVTFTWDQTNGKLEYSSEITNDAFLTQLVSKANTTGDDFGPYRFFCAVDGYEYLLLSSKNGTGDLDFYYLKNYPRLSNELPAITGPFPATLLNTPGNDAYISFDTNQDTAFFSSDAGGNFDIYLKKRKMADKPISAWLDSAYSASTPIDSLNSASADKCPFVYKKIIVFASDRPGGMGGFDLYFSIFRNGKWSTPENFGPDVNTQYDEYRPVIGNMPDYTNMLLMFSSNKPGGKGGYDLYFRGVNISTE
jgi:hypothetical protein